MILLLSIVAGLFALYLLFGSIRPLLEKGVVTAEEWDRIEDESMDLLARRDRLIEELRDLEFEASLNKIEGADLERLRRRYENEALSLMGLLEDDARDFDARIDGDIQRALEAARRRKAELVKMSEAVVPASAELSTEEAPS